MAQDFVKQWLKSRRRRNCAGSLLLAGLSLAGGVVVLFLMFCLFWCVLLFLAPFAGGHPVDIAWPLLITTLVAVVLLIDSMTSRRDDLSNVMLWLVRESFGIGPRLLVESGRWAWRAMRFAVLDVGTCARVLTWLAAKRASVAKDELLRAFPGLTWSKLRAQLKYVDGVLFLRWDHSRVILTQPLRLRLRRWVQPEAPPKPEPVREPAEPAPVTEPEKLGPYEILGLTAGASLAEIKAAYRLRIKECHPDRFADLDDASRELAEEWTKALNAAYATALTEAQGKKRSER